MADKLALFTVFTFLLFAVSTARIFVISKPSPEYDSGIVLPITEKPKSELDETNRLPAEIEKKTQTIDVSTIDHPTERLNFARLHPINRHFSDKTSRIPLRFVRRHPCRKFQKRFAIPLTKASYGNDMMLSAKSYSFDPKTLGDEQVATEWLEFKHNYGDHHHRHHHDHDHDDEDREEMVHLSRRHHKEKRGNNGGFDFMKRIRKFLKHTFD